MVLFIGYSTGIFPAIIIKTLLRNLIIYLEKFKLFPVFICFSLFINIAVRKCAVSGVKLSGGQCTQYADTKTPKEYFMKKSGERSEDW
jgi:hypothetical protein